MGNGGRADAALGADHGDDAANRLGVRRREQPAHRANDLQRADRRDQVVAHAPSHQLAIERDVVHAADDDDPGAGIAVIGKLIETVEDVVVAAFGFQDDDVRRRRALIGFDGRGQAAHLDAQVRLGQAPILAGRLDRSGGLHRLAEGLHRDARRRRDVLIALDDVGGDAFFLCSLISLFHHAPGHFARSLILPESLD